MPKWRVFLQGTVHGTEKKAKANRSQFMYRHYTTNNYRHRTAFCGVTFPTVIWQYSVPLMAVISTADDSNRNSLMSSAALSTAKLLSEM